MRDRTEIETRWSQGEKLFAVHEMDEEEATPITHIEMLDSHSPEQIYAAAELLPPAAGPRPLRGTRAAKRRKS